MRVLIPFLLMIIGLTGFAQEDVVKVNQNKEKIDQLNLRLDALLGGDEVDSVDYKLEYLLREVKAIRSELKEINQSIDDINENGLKKEAVTIKKEMALDTSAYYVILASERDEFLAKRLFDKVKSKEDVKLTQNTLGTWYHVMLDEKMDMSSAIKMTLAKRKEGYSDCWWVTGKKLKIE